VPSIKLNRELTPGRVIPVSQEEYEELTFDPGFMALVNGHYVVIEGIEKEQQVAEVGPVFDASHIEKMLLENDVTKFAKFIPNATEAEKESAVTLAVEHKITNAGIVALIKKYCDVDIINAISMKHDAEEK
jgi:predicted amidohydrolase YtcJ